MRKITLSFDNGPDPDVTPLVLDVLRRHGIKATFFVIGDKVRERRHLIERAHGEGHWIGNHTYNHLVPLGNLRETGMAEREIERTQTLIGPLGHERRLFRPFGNGGQLGKWLLNREALDHLTDCGYTCVLWNTVPQDWVYPSDWVERAMSLCMQQEHPLVVLHDISTGAMENLEKFLDRAKASGANFVQEFPAHCIAVERGRVVGDITWLLAD